MWYLQVVKVTEEFAGISTESFLRLVKQPHRLSLFWTSACHGRLSNWYIALIESDSTLSQHPSGHLATVGPWLLAQSLSLTLLWGGLGPGLLPRMQQTHKTRSGAKVEGGAVCLAAEENAAADWLKEQLLIRKWPKLLNRLKLKIYDKAGRTHHS